MSDLETEASLLPDVPFGEILEARAFGRAAEAKSKKTEELKHRHNKNRPIEQSSKSVPSLSHEIFLAEKKRGRDPRFEAAAGDFQESKFRSNYKFLDDMRLEHSKELRKQLKAQQLDEETRARLQREVQRLNDKVRNDQARDAEYKALKKRKAEEWTAVVDHGKKPFFPKKSDIKKQKLVAKFEQLEQAGSVDKFLAKRRKHTASKQHKHVPMRRAVEM
eukprot:TRINITY_DN1133_c0_g1_i1.p2 TRINITY_DN1133_c0_g1~~TRINITY_DN1133_c0_g1_i1.p2  ORF type:complete len:219 (+),score=29.81 TRINITY_DN1133_c0_g1_i1:79-735(+)